MSCMPNLDILPAIVETGNTHSTDPVSERLDRSDFEEEAGGLIVCPLGHMGQRGREIELRLHFLALSSDLLLSWWG